MPEYRATIVPPRTAAARPHRQHRCWWGCEIVTVGAEELRARFVSRGWIAMLPGESPGSALACLLPLTAGGGRYALQTFPSHCFATDSAGRCRIATTTARQAHDGSCHRSDSHRGIHTCCARVREPASNRGSVAAAGGNVRRSRGDSTPRRTTGRGITQREGGRPGRRRLQDRRSPRSSDGVSLTRSVNPRSAVRRSSRNKLPGTSPAWKSTMHFRGLWDRGCPRPSWRP